MPIPGELGREVRGISRARPRIGVHEDNPPQWRPGPGRGRGGRTRIRGDDAAASCLGKSISGGAQSKHQYDRCSGSGRGPSRCSGSELPRWGQVPEGAQTPSSPRTTRIERPDLIPSNRPAPRSTVQAICPTGARARPRGLPGRKGVACGRDCVAAANRQPSMAFALQSCEYSAGAPFASGCRGGS
jgi:hypothetical protein